MSTEMRYPFLMAMGLSDVEACIAKELIDSGNAINDPGFRWDSIFRTMSEKLYGNNSPERIIQCHLACAASGPRTYGILAERVLRHLQSIHDEGSLFNRFCEYSLIGVLRAGCLLQEAHQVLIGNEFEHRLAHFIRSTILPRHNTPVWGDGEDGTRGLLDTEIKRYFRPKDHVARSLLRAQMPRMLSLLEENIGTWADAARVGLSSDKVMGPGTEILRSLFFAILDIERKSPADLLHIAQTLFP